MGAKTDLLNRYRQAWRHSWQQRQAMDSPHYLRDEVQFMPAALALQEQPVHPAPRYTQWLLMAFAALALLWACLGHIDVVASASGKIVPNGKTKVIQPSEVAVVKAIYVDDGQQVHAGQLLVELDSQITNADVERTESDLQAAEVDNARATALLAAIDNNRPPQPLGTLLSSVDPAHIAAAQRWLQGQYQELRSNLDQVSAAIEQQTAGIHAALASVASLQQSLPIARELAADYKTLQNKGILGKHAWLEREQSRLNQERELQVQQARVSELQAAKKEAEQRRQSVLAQTRRAMLDLQQQAAQKIAALTQELKKAQQRNRLTQLTAPVDGTVQQLAIHTNGGVVTEAQPLMVIVPSDQPIEVEALLENKDIGFVHSGQNVEIKVETFNFTKYGVIDGTVISISNDAIEDEKRGLVYSTRVRLKEKSIQVGDKMIALSPGMAVTAEIKTDKRRVIDYFLSPLKAYANESFRER
ncbi:MAG: HlyD family type I secretion periplasmic adaptor subunit [Pseudomonas sp.]|uniref:HlyD family type I secretion periplasmic adaptor subunit n=1 Tax=Pseudomonas sp. TaxID=306 RepID=UPI0030F0EA73